MFAVCVCVCARACVCVCVCVCRVIMCMCLCECVNVLVQLVHVTKRSRSSCRGSTLYGGRLPATHRSSSCTAHHKKGEEGVGALWKIHLSSRDTAGCRIELKVQQAFVRQQQAATAMTFTVS